MTGAPSQTCGDWGQWQGLPPVCTPIDLAPRVDNNQVVNYPVQDISIWAIVALCGLVGLLILCCCLVAIVLMWRMGMCDCEQDEEDGGGRRGGCCGCRRQSGNYDGKQKTDAWGTTGKPKQNFVREE